MRLGFITTAYRHYIWDILSDVENSLVMHQLSEIYLNFCRKSYWLSSIPCGSLGGEIATRKPSAPLLSG